MVVKKFSCKEADSLVDPKVVKKMFSHSFLPVEEREREGWRLDHVGDELLSSAI